MLEGNFKDVSLPGLLQFLSSEVNKSYRVRVTANNHNGEIFVCRGFVTAAAYGLLEGEDALCEFLSWKDGSFGVELLNPQIEIKRNLHMQVQPTSVFAEHSSFLNEQNVGLNSVLILSKNFGSPEWQETIKQQPLYRDDFMVLGWFGPGRTMRQASREFNFDLVKATEILFRLVATKSILVMRAGSTDATEPGAAPGEGASPATVQRYLTTGGQEAAAARVAHEAAKALALEASNAVAQDAFISTSFKTDAPRNNLQPPVQSDRADMTQVRASMEARLRAKSGRNTYSGPGLSPEQVHDLTAHTSQNTPVFNPTQSSPGMPTPPAAVTLPPMPLRDLLASQTDNKQALEQAIIALNEYSDYGRTGSQSSGSSSAAAQTAAPNSVPKPVAPTSGPGSVPNSGPGSRPGSGPGSGLGSAPTSGASSAPSSGAGLAPNSPPIQKQLNAAPPDTIPPTSLSQLVGQPAQPSQVVLPAKESAGAPNPSGDIAGLGTDNAFAKLVKDEAEAAKEEASRLKTASLPLVSMDIERLLQATFKQTQFGKLALTNPSLDHLRRQTLLDVDSGKTLHQVLSDGNRPPTAVLSSYRYCLDRGFIESGDPVVSLTADLLLGRVELDQYLLQRRRITGDELRELNAQAKRQGESLKNLFLRNGYVTAEDVETLAREQKRFAFK
ncbi:MAG TPA: DUF4388 domain-containing protein [Drouetiella sp.]